MSKTFWILCRLIDDLNITMRIHEILRIDEGDNVRVGSAYVRRLKSRSQLIQLLDKFPALRGWVTANGDVWVWDAEALTHGNVEFRIPDAENPIYFWHPTNSPDIEFEQNGGRDNVRKCDGFLFDLFSFSPLNKDQQIDFVMAKSPLLRQIISPMAN